MTSEERYEFEQELREEAYQDEIHEQKMRSDWNYFCDQNIDTIEQLNEAIIHLKLQCDYYSYDFDITDFID